MAQQACVSQELQLRLRARSGRSNLHLPGAETLLD
jgi:hypothetical protein